MKLSVLIVILGSSLLLSACTTRSGQRADLRAAQSTIEESADQRATRLECGEGSHLSEFGTCIPDVAELNCPAGWSKWESGCVPHVFLPGTACYVARTAGNCPIECLAVGNFMTFKCPSPDGKLREPWSILGTISCCTSPPR